jgi:hypothetical protein
MADSPEFAGPTPLSGAPLSSLPLSSIGAAPVPPSNAPTPFDQAVQQSEVNLITLVKIELTSAGSS